MNGHAGWDCVGQSELVGGRYAVHQQSGLVSAGHRINNSGVIGIGSFSGELVDAREVIQASVDPPDLVGDCQPLQSLVDSRTGPEAQEVAWRPNARWGALAHSAEDVSL